MGRGGLFRQLCFHQRPNQAVPGASGWYNFSMQKNAQLQGIPRVLTIAGSDSGGGAGIQADLKTYLAHKVFGMSAITSVTAQNTQGVLGIHDLPPDFVALQIRAVLDDIGTQVVKTGMLSNAEIIRAVAHTLREYEIPYIVVDPVMRAKGGDPLLQPEAQEALIQEMLPLATVVTPNLPEAEALTQMEIRSLQEMKEAARRIHRMGPRFVLVKGGHLESSDRSIDLLYDGRQFHRYEADRIPTRNTHGTGCTFASAIAANLALGYSVPEAVDRAKAYVTGAIRHSLPLGKGHGPLDHSFRIKPTRVEYDEFIRLDLRVGRVISAEPLKGARVPAYWMRIDLGEAGLRQSSARLTRRYRPEDLVGRLVVVVNNFPPKIIAGKRSEVLVLGAIPEEGDVVLLRPDEEVEPGTAVA